MESKNFSQEPKATVSDNIKGIETGAEPQLESATQTSLSLADIVAYEMPFGKYKGMKIIDIAKNDNPYLIWCSENIGLREPLKSVITAILAFTDV